MAAILRNSSVAVVRTRPRAMPLAMITMRKSIHVFPLLSYIGMGLRLAALRAAGAPLLSVVRNSVVDGKPVTARVISSKTSIAFAGDLDFVRNSALSL